MSTSVDLAERPLIMMRVSQQDPGGGFCLKDFRLVIFAAGLFLFQLANASVLPLAGEILVRKSQTHSSLVISALIIVPQIIVALMAPWVGRRAQDWGRRPLLLIGFAALPIRALGFALISDPLLLLAVQALDGISATVLGVLTALIIADLTGGTGRFNLAQGIVGTASGIGASISTTLSGLVAERLGPSAAFLCIAATASLGTLMIWFLMPETKPPTEGTETTGQTVGHAYGSDFADLFEVKSNRIVRRGRIATEFSKAASYFQLNQLPNFTPRSSAMRRRFQCNILVRTFHRRGRPGPRSC